jgi:SRSO17 transposase
MGYELDVGAQGRLLKYFSGVGETLNNKKRRESFAIYAMGLLGSAERKSAEPLAAAASADPETCDANHQRLLHFLGNSPWNDRAVRREAAEYAIEAMTEHEPIRTWIVDDTGFPKQGTHSVGVQRQYTGTTGKISNCQIGVSLSIATRSAHVPVDFELYLPASWASDAARRAECKIPDEVVFKTKEDLALEMIVRAAENKIPGDIVLADSFYGRSYDFRETVRILGFDYALGIAPTQTMWLLSGRERCSGDAKAARVIAGELGKKAFRRITWRDATMPGKRGKLQSRFALVRVKVAHDDGIEPERHEPLWLLVEWPDGEAAPTKYALTTLPRSMSHKQLVRLLKERYRTERVYEEMKVELGLDHFEGRSFVGWHHHVSVAICCYAFVIAERMRHFPPTAGRSRRARADALAA